jgi:predicted nucleic acid-binding protein
VSACYVDTSALAKRYVNENRSDDVDAFLAMQSLILITPLSRAEMRSMLARRRRLAEIDAELEAQVFATFLDDIRQGFFIEHVFDEKVFSGAVNLIGQMPAVSLRTLDALHLAAAQQLGAETLATADAVMRDAARELGIATEFFGATNFPGASKS